MDGFLFAHCCPRIYNRKSKVFSVKDDLILIEIFTESHGKNKVHSVILM
jgi:hypothetical protein